MEALLGLGILILLGCGLYHALRWAGRATVHVVRAAARPGPLPTPPVRPAALDRRRQVRDAQSRAFQTALLQLDRAPDFRRAATLAAAATLVPAAFRRRQFSRFRPALIERFRRRTAGGADPEALLQTLRDLVTALGVAEFEADYIRAEATARAPRAAPAATPADRMAALRRDHDTRVAAIRQGLEASPELREQLLEAEEQRYRQALLELFEEPPPAAGGSPPL